MKTTTGTCQSCQQPSDRMVGDLCNKCYEAGRPRELCVLCGKMGRVNTRDAEGNSHCHACYIRSKPRELCGFCGRLGRVNRRMPDGKAMCHRCYDKQSINRVFADQSRWAPKRGHEWHLSLEEFKAIVAQACHYCGVLPEGRFVPFLGVDRKDNAVGYIMPNCVPCCHPCNMAKGKMGYDEFIALCRRVAIHHPA
jgi:hypothetical protein